MAENVLRLKVESQEYDAKLKRAREGLNHYISECRKAGGSLEVVEKETLDYVRALGRMDTVSRSASGKLGEMKKAFIDLSAQYKLMTQAERQSPVGKAMAESLNQLKGRINETKNALQSANADLQGSKFGQFGSMIDNVGQRMGITGNLTEMLTSRTALMTAGITASVAAVVKATEAWVGYNNELAKQQQITTVTTGLQGADADRMTDVMRALVDTYEVDFREAVNAANTLMTQFGLTGEEAISLIKDGMQGMIMGDGPKLLQMIQQFAPSFRDAGISASQLVAIIQNSEGGIFTDENMNAIVMGIKNIRLMTNATSEALAKLGINGEEMTRKLNDGSITIFDAMKQVVGAIQQAGTQSQGVGEVMQYVFGRQGAAAGTNLAKAIETLNLNLDETKTQTGDVGESFKELQEANEELNRVLRETFSYNGWQEMANTLKKDLLVGLTEVLKVTKELKDEWTRTPENRQSNIFDIITDGAIMSLGPLGLVIAKLREIKNEMNQGSGGGKGAGTGYEDMDRAFEQIKGGKTREERERLYNAYLTQLNTKLANVGKERRVENSDGSVTFMVDSDETQQKQRQALLKRRTMFIQHQEELMRGNYKPAPIPEDYSDYSDYSGGKGGKGGGGGRTVGNISLQLDSEQIQAKISDALTNAIAKFNVEATKVKPAEDAGPSIAYNAFAASMASDFETAQSPLEKLNEELAKLKAEVEDAPDTASYVAGLQAIADKEKEIAAFKGGTDTTDTAKSTAESWRAASAAISSVSGALSQLEDPSAKIVGIIGMAIANVAAGFGQATSQEGKGGVWYWIAAVAAGLASMVSTISAIHAATGYANGGVVKGYAGGGEVSGFVPGNHLSGDMLNGPQFGINSGELILNRAQQGVIASELQQRQDSSSGGQQTARVSGEYLYLTINNYLRRSGKGEIATW